MQAAQGYSGAQMQINQQALKDAQDVESKEDLGPIFTTAAMQRNNGVDTACSDPIPELRRPSTEEGKGVSYTKVAAGLLAAILVAGAGAYLVRQFGGQLPSISLPSIPVFSR